MGLLLTHKPDRHSCSHELVPATCPPSSGSASRPLSCSCRRPQTLSSGGGGGGPRTLGGVDALFDVLQRFEGALICLVLLLLGFQHVHVVHLRRLAFLALVAVGIGIWGVPCVASVACSQKLRTQPFSTPSPRRESRVRYWRTLKQTGHSCPHFLMGEKPALKARGPPVPLAIPLPLFFPLAAGAFLAGATAAFAFSPTSFLAASLERLVVMLAVFTSLDEGPSPPFASAAFRLTPASGKYSAKLDGRPDKDHLLLPELRFFQPVPADAMRPHSSQPCVFFAQSTNPDSKPQFHCHTLPVPKRTAWSCPLHHIETTGWAAAAPPPSTR